MVSKYLQEKILVPTRTKFVYCGCFENSIYVSSFYILYEDNTFHAEPSSPKLINTILWEPETTDIILIYIFYLARYQLV